ncbi:Putative MCE family protein [Mycobacteroides abscessus]|nr:Putative MCE family protein [Mycobacteroides abscessus]
MAEQSRWQKIKSRPVETYNKTWLGFIAIAVIGALVGGMLLVKAIGFGYTTYPRSSRRPHRCGRASPSR